MARESRRRSPAGSAAIEQGTSPGESGAESERALRRLKVLLTALLVLQGVAGFVPGPLLWGVNHLAYVPLPVRILWPLLAIAILWTRAAGSFGRWLGERACPLLLGRRWIAYGLVPLIGAGLFWVLRCRSHFLGDGWLLGELVQRGVPFHGFDFTTYHLQARLFHWFGYQTDPQAFRLFAWSSIVAGVFYLAAAAWSARHLACEGGSRIALYLLLVFGAPLQMFMGYVESYGFLAVGTLLFVAALAGYYARRLWVLWPAAAFGAALAFHLDALFLAPLVLLLLVWPREGAASESPARRMVAILGPILVGLALGVVFLLSGGYTLGHFRLDFLERHPGQRLLVPWLGEEGLLRWQHPKDLLNLLLLLAPVPIVAIAAALPARRRSHPLTRLEKLLLAGCLWLAVLMLLLHMRLGVARDWDLFAAQAAVFSMAAFMLWDRLSQGDAHPQWVGMTAVAAIALSLPWFWLNAGEARSLQRFRDVIADMPRFQRAYAREEIAKYFRKAGRSDEALTEYRACTAIFPSNPRFHVTLGSMLYNTGQRDEALTEFAAAYAIDSTYVPSLEMLARLHAERGEYDVGLRYARKLAGRPEEPVAAAAIHGAIAVQLGLYDEALAAYRRALGLDPSRTDLLEQIGALALLSGQDAQAERAFRGALQRDPASVVAQSGLVAAIWRPLRDNPGRRAGAERRLREALGLIQGLEAQGAVGADLRAWRVEIEQALAELTPASAPG